MSSVTFVSPCSLTRRGPDPGFVAFVNGTCDFTKVSIQPGYYAVEGRKNWINSHNSHYQPLPISTQTKLQHEMTRRLADPGRFPEVTHELVQLYLMLKKLEDEIEKELNCQEHRDKNGEERKWKRWSTRG